MATEQQRSTMTLLFLFLVIMASTPLTMAACPSYSSIFSFGDSVTDTGNLKIIRSPNTCSVPPYGQTYFRYPTGRCSDGRLIIDFIAQSLGIPMVKPYLGIKKLGVLNEGANFAVMGATALNVSFFKERGVDDVPKYSLSVQMKWFKEHLSTLCNSNKSCHEVLKESLFLVGAIGGNDFNYPLFSQKSIKDVKEYIPYVLKSVISSINELIDLGARTLLVPGNFPMGCNVAYLAIYETKDENQYDSFGCLKWINKFSESYNKKLRNEISKLGKIHPDVKLIYADYYKAALPLYQNPSEYGFIGLKTCCGKGGRYNADAVETCGKPGVFACEDPSKYISWDGLHLTEAAYRLMADGIINGPYSIPKFSSNFCSKKPT